MSLFTREIALRAPAMEEAEGGLSLWFTQPLGIFTRLNTAHFSIRMARFLHHEVTPRLESLGEPPYVFVHDWSKLCTYDTSARVMLTDWGMQLRHRMKCVRIYVGPDSPRLVRMGLTVACAALVVAGYDVTPVPDLLPTFDDLDLRVRNTDRPSTPPRA